MSSKRQSKILKEIEGRFNKVCEELYFMCFAICNIDIESEGAVNEDLPKWKKEAKKILKAFLSEELERAVNEAINPEALKQTKDMWSRMGAEAETSRIEGIVEGKKAKIMIKMNRFVKKEFREKKCSIHKDWLGNCHCFSKGGRNQTLDDVLKAIKELKK